MRASLTLGSRLAFFPRIYPRFCLHSGAQTCIASTAASLLLGSTRAGSALHPSQVAPAEAA